VNTRSQERMFRIDPTQDDKTGERLHGSWHDDAQTNPNLKLRYLNLVHTSGIGGLHGHVPPAAFTAVMRALVSADYDTPNWCEKCHLAGHGCCRCEIACNE